MLKKKLSSLLLLKKNNTLNSCWKIVCVYKILNFIYNWPICDAQILGRTIDF